MSSTFLHDRDRSSANTPGHNVEEMAEQDDDDAGSVHTLPEAEVIAIGPAPRLVRLPHMANDITAQTRQPAGVGGDDDGCSSSRDYDSSNKVDDEQEKAWAYCPRRKRCSQRSLLTITITFVLILAVSVTLGLLLGTSNSEQISSSSSTSIKDAAYYQERSHVFRSLLERNAGASSASFVDPDTPQSQALEWLIYQDQMLKWPHRWSSTSSKTKTADQEEHMEEEEEQLRLRQRLVQRYAVMVLFYACGGINWLSFLTPLDRLLRDQHECHSHQRIICTANSVMKKKNSSRSGGRLAMGDSEKQHHGPDDIVALQLDIQRVSGSLPSEIGLLTHLTALHLGHNFMEGPIPVTLYRKLTNLEGLYLHMNEFSSTISSDIALLTHLRHFSVSGNLLSGTVPDGMANLTRLEKVHLSHNGELTTSTGGSNSNIFDLALQWPELRHLSMSRTKLRGTLPDDIGRRVPHLRHLHLGETQITGSLPDSITQLTNLDTLYFSEQITGTIPQGIGQLSNLVEFELRGHSLHGTLPTGIGLLTDAYYMAISFSNLTGTLPTEMGRMRTLHTCTIERSNLHGTLPTELSQMSSIRYFHISGNHFWGTTPDSFCRPGLEFYFDCTVSCACCDYGCRPQACSTEICRRNNNKNISSN